MGPSPVLPLRLAPISRPPAQNARYDPADAAQRRRSALARPVARRPRAARRARSRSISESSGSTQRVTSRSPRSLSAQAARRAALNARVSGQIDGVGDDRRGGVRIRRGASENGDRVGDAQREAAAGRAGSGDAANAVRPRQGERRKQAGRSGRLTTPIRRFAWREVDGDVAAVVDVSAGKSATACRPDLGEDLVGDAPRDRRHRRDEAARRMRADRLPHSLRDPTAEARGVGVAAARNAGSSSQSSSRTKRKRRGGGAIGGRDCCGRSPTASMIRSIGPSWRCKPPAVGKEPDLRALCAVHDEAFNRRSDGSIGQGFPSICWTWRVWVSFSALKGRT